MKVVVVSKKVMFALMGIVLVTSCGKDKEAATNPATPTNPNVSNPAVPNPGTTPSSAPGAPAPGNSAAPSEAGIDIRRSVLLRNYSSINGRVALAYVLMTFRSSVPSTSVTGLSVRINRRGEPISLMRDVRTGIVNEASVRSMVLSSDSDRHSEMSAELLRGHRGQIFILLNGASEQLASGTNEFIITFSANGQSRTVSVLTEEL